MEDAGKDFFRSAIEALDRHGPEAVIREVAAVTGARGRKLFLPLRLALTARSDGPELDRLIVLLPPETTRRRLSRWAG
ncbi:MAG: hypothetical protein H0W33_14645 [Gammaproteobacteria bacterium]|nr:hypothetical protein [Gammaproteobacteria bacterium]